MSQPLAGLQVVEVASFVAAPLCGQTLAQLGAEVIRVDPIGGGPDLHRWPIAPSGTSLYWTGLNRGKRSIALDVRTDAGRDIVEALLGPTGDVGSGVFVTNTPGRAFDYPTMRAVREDLIHVHVKGTTDGGAAVDYTVNAESGTAMATGHHPGLPTNNVLPAWDLLTGTHAALAVVTALHHRDRTGDGQGISLALDDMASAVNGALGFLGEAEMDVDREPIGNDLYGSFGTDFETSDGRRVMVVALTRRQWRDLCDVTGTTTVLGAIAEQLEVDFDDEGTRYTHRTLIRSLLAPWFASRSHDDVRAALDGSSVLVGTFRTFREAAEQGRRTGTVIDVEQPGIGRIARGRHPLRFTTLDVSDTAPAPDFGRDTQAVLTDLLGRTSDELAQLRNDGVIA